MSQVVIAGAGPTGATLALLLVQRGIAVKLIEASRSFRRMYRGEGLMPSGLDALNQMGLSSLLDGIPHRPLDAWKFFINNQFLFRVDEPIGQNTPPCTLVSQPALLEALIREASAYPNFELVQGNSVQDLLWNQQRVAGVRLSDGCELKADLVIGADGRNSTIRQKANLSLEHQSGSFDILWFKMADIAYLESKSEVKHESANIFYSILHGTHAFGLFRSSEGNLQIGWALHEDDSIDWKQANWSKILASASPPWLADHIRSQAETLERPVLLSVVVGRCPHWSVPGALLIGDAAHPMSPIRAQGINVALRDVIVTANYLVPLLKAGAEQAAIDAVLPQIQAEREPEIIRAQQLQQQEAAQAELLHRSVLVRWAASQFAPLIRQPIRLSWLARQRQLRQGVTEVNLRV